VQKLLDHSSVQTTSDIYADWDIDARTSPMAEGLEEDA
jgi:integrase